MDACACRCHLNNLCSPTHCQPHKPPWPYPPVYAHTLRTHACAPLPSTGTHTFYCSFLAIPLANHNIITDNQGNTHLTTPFGPEEQRYVQQRTVVIVSCHGARKLGTIMRTARLLPLLCYSVHMHTPQASAEMKEQMAAMKKEIDDLKRMIMGGRSTEGQGLSQFPPLPGQTAAPHPAPVPASRLEAKLQRDDEKRV